MANRSFSNRGKCKEIYEEYKPIKNLGGLDITHIPEKPKRANLIDGYGLPAKQRKFAPIQFPDLLFDDKQCIGFRDLSEEESKEFLTKITEYRKNGYWFFNNDKLEYITGDHWYYLNFIKIDIRTKDASGLRRKLKRLPNWVDADRNFFIFWREAELNDFSFGMMYISSRRTGKSAKSLSILLNAATSVREAHIGIQAQNSTMAKSLFKRLVRTWSMLPKHPWSYPEHSGDTSPSQILKFEPSATRSSKIQVGEDKDALYSKIEHRPTTEYAFDGEGMFRLFIDEGSKIEGCDINELYNVNRETMADPPYATGKMILTSTAENIGGKTLEPFQRMFERSNVTKLNELGQTASGLFGYFQGADMGYRFDPSDVKEGFSGSTFGQTLDEWGYSNRENARELILAQRKSLKGTDLIQFIRKYPLEVSEAFAVEKGASPFNTLNLNSQLKYNIDAEIKPRRGNFEWVGKEVMFYPHEKGKWLVAWMPPEEYRCRLSHGFDSFAPTVRECWTGIDPYEADKTVEKGSDAASVTYCNVGHFFDRITPVCIYVNRPPTAEEMFDDLLKQSIFYSSKTLVEVNAGRGLVRYWKKKGYKGLLLADPLSPKKHPDGCHTRNDDTRNTMVNKQRTYIEENVGLVNEDELEYANFQFEELLKDHRDFEAGNWTPSDLTVASMLALHGIPVTKKEKKKFSFKDIIGEYDNSGSQSRLKR